MSDFLLIISIGLLRILGIISLFSLIVVTPIFFIWLYMNSMTWFIIAIVAIVLSLAYLLGRD